MNDSLLKRKKLLREAETKFEAVHEVALGFPQSREVLSHVLLWTNTDASQKCQKSFACLTKVADKSGSRIYPALKFIVDCF